MELLLRNSKKNWKRQKKFSKNILTKMLKKYLGWTSCATGFVQNLRFMFKADICFMNFGVNHATSSEATQIVFFGILVNNIFLIFFVLFIFLFFSKSRGHKPQENGKNNLQKVNNWKELLLLSFEVICTSVPVFAR